jgi:diguanylate cyclase (GGDEF)-like protein/PAS domain S-box-containing protein
MGRPLARFVTPEDQLLVAERFQRTLEGEVEPLEFRVVTSTGEVRWVRSSARPIFENGEAVGVRGVLMDVTDLKSTQEELQRTNSALEAIVEASPLAIIAINPDKTVGMWNPAAEQLFGWSPDEALGNPYPLAAAGSEAEFAVLLEKVLAGGEVTGFETQRRKKDGELIDVSIFAAPLRGGDGEINGALGVIADITARKRAEETIRHLAYHDPLTGLPNRALLTDRLEVSMAQARRSGEPLAVLYLDMDNFKVINDSVGHTGGDVLLKNVADRLCGLVRETDTIARVGGDEFTILLVPPCGESEAADIGRRIVTEIQGRWEFAKHEFNVSGSIGVAIYPTDGSDSSTLLKNADRAMYAAKSEGRNRLRVFRSSMNEASEYVLEMERDLRRGLREDQFAVHYQPQIDLATGRIVGVEALVRWNHPERGLLLPGDFLALAEETGVIVEIDEWVLETAARQLVDWHAAGYADLNVAVNLSAVHFANQGFLRKMRRVLDRTRADPTHLKIEITETVAMHQTRRTLRVLSTLKRMGIGVVIDDFGTGHASLTYLRRFPVDAIKIDRSFVNGIGRNSADETLVMAIVALAHSLDLDVIAEGVETDEQFEFLKNLRAGSSPERPRGCDYFQGFLSSRAVPAEEIGALLDTETAPLATG